MRLTTRLAMLSVLALSATVPAGAGCLLQRVCPLEAYVNGLRLQIGAFSTPGSYRIDIEAEGDVVSLQYAVTAERGLECAGACDVRAAHLEVLDLARVDATGLLLNISKLEGDPGPKRVIVRLFRDGALLGEDTLEPHYERDEPNGEGCGERVSAEAMIVVP